MKKEFVAVYSPVEFSAIARLNDYITCNVDKFSLCGNITLINKRGCEIEITCRDIVNEQYGSINKYKIGERAFIKWNNVRTLIPDRKY